MFTWYSNPDEYSNKILSFIMRVHVEKEGGGGGWGEPTQNLHPIFKLKLTTNLD